MIWLILLGVVIIVLAGLLGLWPHRKPKPRREQITVLVPYRSDHALRARTWHWLRAYWKFHLPHAQFIVGHNDETPFCKTAAVNDAFEHVHGDVVVIMDSDCYMDAAVIEWCAAEIRLAREAGQKLWFIPYRRFYRLSKDASVELLKSDPRDPLVFGDPPDPDQCEHIWRNSSGHWWGALIQIMPREAFEAVGGMDERFKGWGGEDISFMHAVDTLYARHKTADAPVYHSWHPSIKGKWMFTRQWEDQPTPDMNDPLAWRYVDAVGDRERMSRLLDERYVERD